MCLAEHHRNLEGVWSRSQKGSGVETVTKRRRWDVALCYGWIEARRGASTRPSGCRSSRRAARRASGGFEDQRESGPRSSRRSGMQPTGAPRIERAKPPADGRPRYERRGKATVPTGSAEALDANPARQALSPPGELKLYEISYRVRKPRTGGRGREADRKKLIGMLGRGRRYIH